MSKTQKDVFKLGQPILYYNKWTGFENEDISSCFRKATYDDLVEMKDGGSVWINQDPIHPNGKVYGYVQRRVLSVEVSETALRICWGIDRYSNKVRGESLYPLFILTEPQKLSGLLKRYPLATQVISDESQELWNVMRSIPEADLVEMLKNR